MQSTTQRLIVVSLAAALGACGVGPGDSAALPGKGDVEQRRASPPLGQQVRIVSQRTGDPLGVYARVLYDQLEHSPSGETTATTTHECLVDVLNRTDALAHPRASGSEVPSMSKKQGWVIERASRGYSIRLAEDGSLVTHCDNKLLVYLQDNQVGLGQAGGGQQLAAEWEFTEDNEAPGCYRATNLGDPRWSLADYRGWAWAATDSMADLRDNREDLSRVWCIEAL